jgi:hypothetical protein
VKNTFENELSVEAQKLLKDLNVSQGRNFQRFDDNFIDDAWLDEFVEDTLGW